MAPPPPPNTFFADQIAQDAFDANLNKTVFLIALAFAVLIQLCVLVYLGWLVVRRCFGRSRDDVPEECEGDEAADGGEGERKCVKEGFEVPSLPRALVLPGLLTEDTPPPPLPIPSRHHRSPSLRESIFGSSDPSQPTSTSTSWFNLRWSWEVPVVQIDLERAAAPATPAASSASPVVSPASASPASLAAAAFGADSSPDSLATSTSPAISPTTPTSAISLANPTSAPFSVATPTQILSSEVKQARLQVPRIVIEDVDSLPSSPSSSPPSPVSSSASPCPSSPRSSITTNPDTTDFEMDVDSALGIDTPNHDEDHDEDGEQGREEEQIQTRIDPTYLYVPPTSCYPPRELVESPSGRGFIFPSSSAFASSSPGSSPSTGELTPCEETKTISRKKAKAGTRSKIAKRKSPSAYENTNTFNAHENATQPTKTATNKQTLSARVFGALADLSNFTRLTTATRPISLVSSASVSPSAPKLSLTPNESSTTPNESFFSRCEEALYDIESSGHGGVW